MKKLSLRIGSLLLAVLMMITAAPLLSAADSNTADSGVIHKKITVIGSATTDEITLGTTFDPAAFFASSSSYNDATAEFALIMAIAAGHNDDTAGESKLAGITRCKYAAGFFASFGFGSAKYYNYDKSLTDTSDKVAFSIARRDVSSNGKTAVLLAVPIRGLGYGSEWVGNFRVGPVTEDKSHYGFDTAADGVYDAIVKYIADNKLDASEVKIIVSGFSRAAAVANLTAATLDRDSDFNYKNIYAYTFATPTTTMQPREMASTATLYSNIFNVLNPSDAVTELPLSSWGFIRYGRDVYLPNAYTCENYTQIAKSVRKNLNALTNNKLDKKTVASLSTFKEVTLGKNVFIEEILGEAVGSYKDYYSGGAENSLQSLVIDGFNGGDVTTAFMSVFSGRETKIYSRYTDLTGANGAALRKYIKVSLSPVSVAADYIVLHHIQETYLALLMSADADDYAKEPYTRYIVKLSANTNAALNVGSAEKTLPVWSDSNFIVAGGSDIKLNYTPSDGKGSFTVEKYSGDGYLFSIVTVKNALLSEVNEKLADAVYKDGCHAVVFEKTGTGGGTVGENQIIASGTSLKLTATPNANSTFAGWYSGGKLLSKKATVTVKPTSDKLYEARFEAKP